jgi:hypothetical protein
MMLVAFSPGCSEEAGSSVVVPELPGAADVFSSRADSAEIQASPTLPCARDVDCTPIWPNLTTCERAVCDTSLPGGECIRVVLDGGEPCDDGDPCTQDETCTVSGCMPGQQAVCASISCQEFVGCDEFGACLYQFSENGELCEDGNACTTNDTCSDGVCIGVYAPGDPGCSCTRDSDCPVPDDLCDGQPSCQQGTCVMVPVAGIQCDPTTTGPCEEVTCVDGECVISPKATGTSCDDGNPCTTTDTCSEQECVGADNLCQCGSDDDCFQYEDGDLCNGSLHCNLGLCVVEPDSVVVCEPLSEPCVVNICQPTTGLCASSARPDGSVCNDGDACTLGESCLAGVCVSSTPASCGAPKLCQGTTCDAVCLEAAICDQTVGCPSDSSLFLEGLPCDDGLACRGLHSRLWYLSL